MAIRTLGRQLAVALATLMLASLVHAKHGTSVRVDFTIENLTHAITFRPFLLAAHQPGDHVFQTGESSSVALQLMAECGGLESDDFPDLVTQVRENGADFVANPVNIANPFQIPLGLLFPAGTAEGDTAVPFAAGLPGMVHGSFMITDRRNTHLSVVAMLLPTNDAFAGLDAARLPRWGKRTYYLSAFDAGTEANNEVMADDNPLDCVPDEPGYPVDPLGHTGTGATGDFNFEVSDRVHVHRGNVGDADTTGGFSDLDSRIHRWADPVVKVTVNVRPNQGRKW